jgi:hypothetical protein
MARLSGWHKEPGVRLEGTRDLDRSKVQAPCIMRASRGGYRLFYTAVGPGKPFADCQGYILSAVSQDGLAFTPEPGIRVAPQPGLGHLSLRALAPSVVAVPGGWRMYFEARGPAERPTVICSALSEDQLAWRLEAGIRLAARANVGAPRACVLPDGGVRLLVFRRDAAGTSIVSAISDDGLDFAFEPAVLLRDRTSELDGLGITAAEIVPGEPQVMVFSAWQDRPAGSASAAASEPRSGGGGQRAKRRLRGSLDRGRYVRLSLAHPRCDRGRGDLVRRSGRYRRRRPPGTGDRRGACRGHVPDRAGRRPLPHVLRGLRRTRRLADRQRRQRPGSQPGQFAASASRYCS